MLKGYHHSNKTPRWWQRYVTRGEGNKTVLQGLTLYKNSLYLSIQTSAVRIALWLRMLTTPPGHVYGDTLRNTWPTREHVEMSTFPPHIHTCKQQCNTCMVGQKFKPLHCVQKKHPLVFFSIFLKKNLSCCKYFRVWSGDINETIYVNVKHSL